MWLLKKSNVNIALYLWVVLLKFFHILKPRHFWTFDYTNAVVQMLCSLVSIFKTLVLFLFFFLNKSNQLHWLRNPLQKISRVKTFSSTWHSSQHSKFLQVLIIANTPVPELSFSPLVSIPRMFISRGPSLLVTSRGTQRGIAVMCSLLTMFFVKCCSCSFIETQFLQIFLFLTYSRVTKLKGWQLNIVLHSKYTKCANKAIIFMPCDRQQWWSTGQMVTKSFGCVPFSRYSNH